MAKLSAMRVFRQEPANSRACQAPAFFMDARTYEAGMLVICLLSVVSCLATGANKPSYPTIVKSAAVMPGCMVVPSTANCTAAAAPFPCVGRPGGLDKLGFGR